MIEIQDDIAPPQRRARTNKVINNAINKYQRAYRGVYGKWVECRYQNPWIKIEGQDSRVKLSRLKELTKQLEMRLGE